MAKKMKSAARAASRKGIKNTEQGYTITQIAEVMSHALMEAVEIFNENSSKMFEGRPVYEIPEFKLNIVPIMFSPQEYVRTGIESRAVFTLEMKQFGSSSVVYRDGFDFTCERDRANVNAWLPKIWQKFFQYTVNTSLLYNLALNPDNPEVVKEAEKAKQETNDKDKDKDKDSK